MYSTVDRLLWVRDVLDGTPEMSTLLESCWDLVLEVYFCVLICGVYE